MGSYRGLILFFAIGLTGCTQTDVACPTYEAIGPLTALDYPVSGSTAVPDEIGILIFSGTSRQKIELIPSTLGATPIATRPTSLPSPVPDPISTPATAANGYFAVSIPSLSPMTSYNAEGLTRETSGCGGSSMVYAGGGKFTTQ